jgi:hypothetical protein
VVWAADAPTCRENSRCPMDPQRDQQHINGDEVIDLLRAGAAAALCTLGLTAQAQTFHAGLAGGATRSNSGCVGAITCDKSDVGGRAWVGVTNKDGLGLEIVGHDFGSVRYTATNALGATIAGKATLRGVGIGPIWDYREGNWSFHARAGIGRYETDVRETTGSSSVSAGDYTNEFYVGAGFGYRLGTRFTVIAAIDSGKANNRTVGYQYEVVMYSLGVQFGF